MKDRETRSGVSGRVRERGGGPIETRSCRVPTNNFFVAYVERFCIKNLLCLSRPSTVSMRGEFGVGQERLGDATKETCLTVIVTDGRNRPVHQRDLSYSHRHRRTESPCPTEREIGADGIRGSGKVVDEEGKGGVTGVLHFTNSVTPLGPTSPGLIAHLCPPRPHPRISPGPENPSVSPRCGPRGRPGVYGGLRDPPFPTPHFGVKYYNICKITNFT